MTYTLAGALVNVFFPDTPFPTSTPVLKNLFPGRKFFFNTDGKWVGVECSKDEWKLFLDAMESTFLGNPNTVIALAIIQEFRRGFYVFLAGSYGMQPREVND